jgi:hypothetical protein
VTRAPGDEGLLPLASYDSRCADKQPGQGQPGRDRELRPAPALALAGAVPAGGGTMVILAVGPEAGHDRRGFDRAVRLAEERLKEIEG